MIGVPELLIVLFIVLLVTGAYKKLPSLGRSAGSGLRSGGEKAREFADANAPKAKELAAKASTKSGEVGSKVGDKIDPKEIGRKAGSAAKEARDMRAEFKGFLDAPAPSSAKKKSEPKAPGPAADAARRPDADDAEPAVAQPAKAPATKPTEDGGSEETSA